MYRSGMGDYRYSRMMVGDPGFFSSIGHALGTVARVGGGAALGFLTGGPVGALRGAVGGAAAATATNVRRETLAAGGSESALTPALRARHAAVLARASATHPIGGSSAGTPHGVLTSTRVAGALAAGGRRRRRMNVGNIKALRRANRRAHGFLKVFSRAVSYFHPHKKKGRAFVHFKKRRAA